MKISAKGILTGWLLLSFHAVSFAAQPEKVRVTIAVAGGKSILYNLPLAVAERKGYFSEEGLQVRIADFAGGSKALMALTGGSADVVSGAYEHTIKLQRKNQYLTAFIMTGQASQIVVAVSRKTMPDYRQISDLKGKVIGVSAPGSSSNRVADAVLSRGGLKSGDVSYTGVGTTAAAVEALRSGRIDAIASTEPVISLLEQRHDIIVIADTRTPEGTAALFGGPVPAGSLYAKETFLSQNPATVQALASAMLKALRWLDTATPDEVAALVPENYLLGDPALYKTAFTRIRPAISRDGLFTPLAIQNALDVLSAFDSSVRPERIDLSRTWTNRFVTEALRNEQK